MSENKPKAFAWAIDLPKQEDTNKTEELDNYTIEPSLLRTLQKSGINTNEVIDVAGDGYTSGYFLVATKTDIYTVYGVSATKVTGVTGEVTAVTGNGSSSNYFLIGTTDGAYTMLSNSTSATKVTGVTGEVTAVNGNGPSSNYFFIICTTDGAYTGSNNRGLFLWNNIFSDPEPPGPDGNVSEEWWVTIGIPIALGII